MIALYMMSCTIHWISPVENKDTLILYGKYYENIKRCNLLQSRNYAYAMRKLKGQNSRIGLIQIDGQDAGLVQILEVGILKNMIHAVLLDRGPLWFEGFGTSEHFQAFVEAFKQGFPKRLGRRIRFIPEIADSPEIRAFLSEQGYKRQDGSGYQTAWIDLDQSEDTLRKKLKGKWRGHLTRAEKQDVVLEWDDRGALFPWMMEGYIRDKATKGYDGPSLALMEGFTESFVPSRDMLIGRALKGGKPIGGVLLLCHGRSATYQIGWNTDAGRRDGAHYLLLWDALKILKARGVRALDLGGMNDETAANVKKFKEGMGGCRSSLSGLYTY